MDKLTEMLQALADKIGAPAYAATLDAVRMDGYSHMVLWTLTGFISLGMGRMAAYLWARGKRAGYLDEDFWYAGSICIGAAALGMFLATLYVFIDPWTWAAINHPELYLAKRIIGF